MAIATVSPFEVERQKYEHIWREIPQYRQWSPGEELIGPFLAITGIQPGRKIVDVGCGSGRASVKLCQLLMRVVMVDATIDALDKEVAEGSFGEAFVSSCLWGSWPRQVLSIFDGPADVVYCCDVLEHIPQEFTLLVVERCLEVAQRAFFSICFDEDVFGATIGQPLHLTVQSFEWWRDRLGELGTLIDARDLLGRGIFLLEREVWTPQTQV